MRKKGRERMGEIEQLVRRAKKRDPDAFTAVSYTHLILFGQLSNDLIDDLAVSLALQLAHNSLHHLPLIFRSQNLCEFLFQNCLEDVYKRQL